MKCAVSDDDRQPAPGAADPRPWEESGAVRRDVAPHRSNVLLLLATVALVLGLLSFGLVVTGWAAVPLAFAVEGLAQGDLKEMEAGRMDPNGRKDTERAHALAEYACFLGGAGGFVCGLLCCMPLAVRVLGGF
jgi:hypothetical protein